MIAVWGVSPLLVRRIVYPYVPLNPMVNHRVPIFSDIYTKKNGDSVGQTHRTGWGPQDSVQLPEKWLNSMVYGRYHYS